MTISVRIALAVSLAFTLGCRERRRADSTDTPRTATPPVAHDIDRAGMDPSVAPGDDFFRYANGGWLKKTEIPADRSSFGAGTVLFDRARDRTHKLLETAGTAPDGSAERKVGDYYASYMDEAAIEKNGLAPLHDQLAAIAAITDA